MAVLFASWVLTLLTIFTLSFNHEARLDLLVTGIESDRVASRALARSGIAVLEELLSHTSDNEWDAPVEGWDRNPAFRRVQVDEGFFSVGYATGEDDSTASIYGVQDEGRRVSIQDVDRNILSKLDGFTSAGIQALLDFVPKSGTWPSSAEAIPGLDVASRSAARRYLTPHPNGGVNINTAPREVLRALGIPGDAVDRIVSHREGPDGRPATRDDEPFTSVLLPTGGLDDCRLSEEAAAVVSLLARKELLVARSEVYRIRSRGWLVDRAYFYEIEAVVKHLSGGTFEVLDWRETWIP